MERPLFEEEEERNSPGFLNDLWTKMAARKRTAGEEEKAVFFFNSQQSFPFCRILVRKGSIEVEHVVFLLSSLSSLPPPDKQASSNIRKTRRSATSLSFTKKDERLLCATFLMLEKARLSGMLSLPERKLDIAVLFVVGERLCWDGGRGKTERLVGGLTKLWKVVLCV